MKITFVTVCGDDTYTVTIARPAFRPVVGDRVTVRPITALVIGVLIDYDAGVVAVSLAATPPELALDLGGGGWKKVTP